ncbi:MAG: type II toxin-antitoxin system HigB family toxin [Anaerolineales bacterium]|jgi:mRNA interferase HigB
MRVVNLRLIHQFSAAHPDCKSALDSWVAELQEAEWKTPVDLKRRYPSASVLRGKRVVFNIKGNRYRALTLIDYESGIVIVKELGTHAEYDGWVL